MRKLSTKELSRLRDAQAEAFNDTCNIFRVTKTAGTYSDDETTIITGTFSVPCGFEFVNGQINEGGQFILVPYDVILRLPTGTFIDTNDQIQLLSKGDIPVSGTFIPANALEIRHSIAKMALKRKV